MCLFILDRQFYDVFTSSSIKTSRTNDLNELILNCSQTIPSTIDRDMVESEKQFYPYLFNPLLIETMSNYIFTAINVIQYQVNLYCLIIGTSQGHLFTAFTDSTFKTIVFEELILPINMRYAIKSITYKQMEDANEKKSYGIILTNHIGYMSVKLTSCETKLCFECWIKDCSIKKLHSTIISHQCSLENNLRFMSMNSTEIVLPNSSLLIHRNLTPNNKILFSIIIPMSLIVLILSILILILIQKSTKKIKQKRFYPIYSRKTQDSHTYTNNLMYRTNNNKLKTSKPVFPTKSELCIRRISSNPVYSTVSSQSLPSLVLPPPPSSSSSTTVNSTNKSQPLSVQRLYKSYV